MPTTPATPHGDKLDAALLNPKCSDDDRHLLAEAQEAYQRKTMFQEAAGTAARLKQGCPYARYYVLNEFLDMTPEDPRLTAVDNVYLLRHARRLPVHRRNKYEEIRRHRRDHPIDPDVLLRFVENLRAFLRAIWYDPDAALQRGSFV